MIYFKRFLDARFFILVKIKFYSSSMLQIDLYLLETSEKFK